MKNKYILSLSILFICFLLSGCYVTAHPFKTVMHVSTMGLSYIIEEEYNQQKQYEEEEYNEQKQCKKEIEAYLNYPLQGCCPPEVSLSCRARAMAPLYYTPQPSPSYQSSSQSSSQPEPERYTIYGVTHKDGNIHYGPTGYIEGDTIYGVTERDGNIHYGPTGYIEKER